MKKILFALSAVALLFATSCNKETNAPENITAGEGEFLATIDNGANPQNAPVVKDGMSTMTTIDGNRFVIWETDDEISINGSIYTTDASGSSVIFSGGNATGSTFHAFFPATIAGTDNAGTLPATQTIEFDNQGNAKVTNLPMYATSNNNQLTFHNICAALKITVPVACNSIVVSANENICGEFTVDNTTYTAQLAETGEHLGNSVTVTRSTGSFAANETFYVAIPAGTYHNFTIQCKDGDGSVIPGYAKVINEYTFTVNKVYNLTLTAASVPPTDGFCFTSVSTNSPVTISLINPNGGTTPVINLEYCKYVASTGAYSKWDTYTIGTTQVTLDNNGDKVYFRAGASGNTNFSSNNNDPGKQFASTGGNVTVSGNIMYLLSQTPATALTPTNNKAFVCLFHSMTNLTDASGLILPTTLSEYCFSNMFYGCSALTAAPILSATTLQNGCYGFMFNNCKKLSAVTMLASLSWQMLSGSATMFNGWLEEAGTEATNNPTIYVTDNNAKQIMQSSPTMKPTNWSVEVYTAPSQIRRKQSLGRFSD